MLKWWSLGVISLVNVYGAAFVDEHARAEEPSHAVEKPSPAAVLTSQLCRIDIEGEKKDQWMRLPKSESWGVLPTSNRIVRRWYYNRDNNEFV
jgi:hypothetical protein